MFNINVTLTVVSEGRTRDKISLYSETGLDMLYSLSEHLPVETVEEYKLTQEIRKLIEKHERDTS
jgi:hypothetical protein